jgi:hypothetical protein
MSRLQWREVVSIHNCSVTSSISVPRNKHAAPRVNSQGVQSISLLCTIVLLSLVMSACGRTSPTTNAASGNSEWHEFQGTWTATGTRNIMRLEGDRNASIASFNGSLVLAGPSRPNVGFRSEAIVFNDSSTGMIGRAVWTDEHGDQAFSELQGMGTRTDNKIVGTFVGGTGRYAGAVGTYEFSWRFVLESEDGNMQGESMGLKGRVRGESSHATSSLGDPRS